MIYKGIECSLGPISIDYNKYTFFTPVGDYRIHIYRCDEPWLVLEQGSKAICALLCEVEELREASK